MKLNFPVPFYENTEDDTHCVQACFRMVLKYFSPEQDYSWVELDKITKKEPGLWTWPMAGMCWFVDKGYEVVCFEEFDYSALKKKGYKYLVEKFGEEIATEQLKHSNLEKEIGSLEKFLRLVEITDRIPNIADIKKYLKQEYLVVASVNYRSLHGREGYVGHSVIVRGYDDDGLYLNEPGRPGIENFYVTHAQFEKGWSYPDESANNLIAIRKRP